MCAKSPQLGRKIIMEDTLGPSALDQLKQWLSSSRQELKDAGVVAIIGTYSGEGDDGRFEEIRIIGEDEQDIDYQLPESVEGLIEQLEPELAPQGYENGDGGGGEFRLEVESGKITHESYFLSITRVYHMPEEH